MKFLVFYTSLIFTLVSYQASASLSGIIHIGTGLQYTSLTKPGGLFSAINSGGLSGNVIAMISTDISETAQVSLNPWAETGPGNYRLYIVPCDTATVVKRISGYFNNSSHGLITLNGADRVIIDGNLNQSGRFLRFTALDNTNGSIFQFENGSTHDTIRNCIIEAGANPISGSIRGVSLKTTYVTNGNSFNAISSNIFRGNPSTADSHLDMAIASDSPNDTNYCNKFLSLTNNEISGVITSGIAVWGALHSYISGNSIFSNVVSTNTNNFVGIDETSGCDTHITGNFIGGSEPHCAGNKWISVNQDFYAIRTVGSMYLLKHYIENNTIRNFSFSNSQQIFLIYLHSGLIEKVSGNFIGDPVDTASIVLPANPNFAGIYLNFTTLVREISGNTIAGIRTSGSGTGFLLQGIHIDSYISQTDSLLILNNHIHHFYSNMDFADYAPIFCGISDNSTLTKRKYSGNLIHDFYNNGTGNINNSVIGISFRNYSGAAILEKNQIFRLYSNLANSVIYGIYLFGGTYTVRNNMIALSNEIYSQQITLFGIYTPGYTTMNMKVLGNSIRIGGIDGSSLDKSVCLNVVTSGSVSCVNNILTNCRTGSGTRNALICSSGILYTGDHNAFYNTGPQFGAVNGIMYANFLQYQQNCGQDSNSIFYNPVFQDTGTGDLHLKFPADTVLHHKGIPVAGLTQDFDGQIRSALHPDIGADETFTAKILGHTFYQNQDSTNLPFCKIFLINNNDQKVDSTYSDTSGNFIFSGAYPGNYHLKVSCSLPWGGANMTDALLILKKFVGLINLNDLQNAAAKVSPDAMVSSVDALILSHRFAGIISTFSKPDWIFDQSDFAFLDSDVNLLVPGLCMGDVNGSYVP